MGKKKRIISGEALESLWAEYSWHLSRVLGYNREAFRKKGCLLTNTRGYVGCTVYVCMGVYLLHCVNAKKILWRPCNHWMTHFHISTIHKWLPATSWKILGKLPCSLRALSSAGWAAADEQGPSQRPLPALFGQLLRPMAVCHAFSIAWADTMWFLATDRGSSTPPGELFISYSPIWIICISFLKSPKSGSGCLQSYIEVFLVVVKC